ncbi:hypothetical protein TA3x_002027 [Tundrisphaera sp. TA3]|uniref:hypothetical protein n=1 Tax=Tundrisphaera sp. TA3 TaxID=3435775 RepID=UPI003EB939A0
MRARRNFQPGFVEALEERKVLSGAGGGVATTAALHRPSDRGARGQSSSVVAMVNASFSAFIREYGATRAVYLSSIQARTAPIGATSTNPITGDPAGDLAAINQYTQQRVDLLAQQLRNNFQQSPIYGKKDRDNPSDPMAIITKKINASTNANGKIPFDKGTLGRALFQATPSPTASPTAIALNSLAQDNAIEAARVAIINGINTFKHNSTKKH